MSREFLYIVKESAYLTPIASPVLGTDAIYIRLDGSNNFTMRPKPNIQKIPHGGGLAITALEVASTMGLAGNLQTILYASQAQFLVQWAMQRINTGQTSPWTTTEPVGDLASCSVYHGIQRSDGSVKRRVYLGCKVTSLELSASEEQPVFRLNLGLSGSTPQGNAFDGSSDPTSTVFPDPAETSYPSDIYLFTHAGGNLTIGSSRTQFGQLQLRVQNKMDARFFENRFVQVMRFLGRDSTLATKLYYKPSPDDRSSYESLTAQTASFELNNSVHTMTVDFHGQNRFDEVNDELPLDKVYDQNATVMNLWDTTAGGDLAIAFT